MYARLGHVCVCGHRIRGMARIMFTASASAARAPCTIIDARAVPRHHRTTYRQRRRRTRLIIEPARRRVLGARARTPGGRCRTAGRPDGRSGRRRRIHAMTSGGYSRRAHTRGRRPCLVGTTTTTTTTYKSTGGAKGRDDGSDAR